MAAMPTASATVSSSSTSIFFSIRSRMYARARWRASSSNSSR